MKVVVLGAGEMGFHAARTASAFDFVTGLVVADRSREAALHTARACRTDATVKLIDVNDESSLRHLLGDGDVVLNTVGPFYRFGVSVLEAAIESDCHYFDINDDWEPTLDMLNLADRAAKRGVVAVLGLGASPGITNLLAAKAIAQLDHVQDVVTGWSLDAMGAGSDSRDLVEGKPNAALVHWMQQCSGMVRIFRDGEYADVRPVEKMEVEFPGMGTGKAWTVGHPEAVTIPRTFASARNAVNVMTGPTVLLELVAEMRDSIDAEKLSVDDAARLFSQPMPPEMKAEAEKERDSMVQLPPLFAVCRGLRDGRKTTVGSRVLATPDGGMGELTGIPLALGLSLLHSRQLSRAGVVAPEAVIDPDHFFDLFAPYCASPNGGYLNSRNDLVRVTEI